MTKIEPIDFTIQPETHPPRYWIHKFWARKPFNVTRKYIEHYTEKDDIILDPFCGSGVVPIEGLFLGRKVIGVDLNPLATFLTEMTVVPVNLNKMQEAFEKIKVNVKKKIENLYLTPCRNCGKQAVIISTTWWNSASPTHIFMECPYCEHRGLYETTDEDIKRIEDMERKARVELNSYKFPKSKLPLDADVESVDQLFSKRNLLALVMLWKEIEAIKNPTIRDLMKTTFTANLEPVSKLVPVRKSRLDRGVVPAGSWYDKRYRVSKNRVEGNVFYYFEHRFKKTFRAKKDSNNELTKSGVKYKEGRTFNDLTKGKNFIVLTQSATDLRSALAKIPNNQVDYILTDPPYADSVQYFDMSTMYTSWLGHKLDFKNEIVINPKRKKKVEGYRKALIKAFKEMHRVLKRNGYCSVWFHYKDPDIWFALLSAAEYAGFEKVALVPQPPAKTSGTQGGNPESAVVGDFIVTFKRLDKARRVLYINSYGLVVNVEKLVMEETAKLLVGKPEGLYYKDVYNHLIQVMINRGLYHKVKEKIEKPKILAILKENFKKEENRWLFNDENEVLKKLVTEDELVKHYLASILNSYGEKGASISEIHSELLPLLPKLETTDPDRWNKKLVQLLKEVRARQTFEGKWTLFLLIPRKRKLKKPEHNEVIYMLFEIGRKCGYQVYIGKAEQGREYMGKRLGDLEILKNLPKEIVKSLTTRDRQFIEQIDVLWILDDEIHAFEIEFSTGITSGGQRLGNLIDALTSKLIHGYVVVLESSRDERAVNKKLGDRVFAKYVEKSQLSYILYPHLRDLHKVIKKYAKLEVNVEETIKNIAKTPRVRANLSRFT